MKKILGLFVICGLAGLPIVANAGDWHTGLSLICSDCHVAHYSQSHGYVPSSTNWTPLGSGGPYAHLLRNEVNELCLTCHDAQSTAPDVFGANEGVGRLNGRLAGGLNAAPGHRTPPAGYDAIDGHSLWSKATAPGGSWSNSDHGLECSDCHMPHGHRATQYRNLWLSSTPGDKFLNKTLTYVSTTNDETKDVFQKGGPRTYAWADVEYNEPDATKSAYGNWCGSCHTNFHGAGGAPNMGGASGGRTSEAVPGWLRHPVADVNIGASYGTHVSSLTQYNTRTNRVKVMDSQEKWDGTSAEVTPSCFSCHKSHGNMNGFGLIYMKGVGVATITEEGDGGLYKDLCRQCHVQGAS